MHASFILVVVSLFWIMTRFRVLWTSAGAELKSSLPMPRAKQGARRWQVELGAGGMLVGCQGPGPSDEVCKPQAYPDLTAIDSSANNITIACLEWLEHYGSLADADLVCKVEELLRRVLEEGHWLTEDEVLTLFSARGANFDAVCQAAGARHVMALCVSRMIPLVLGRIT